MLTITTDFPHPMDLNRSLSLNFKVLLFQIASGESVRNKKEGRKKFSEKWSHIKRLNLSSLLYNRYRHMKSIFMSDRLCVKIGKLFSIIIIFFFLYVSLLNFSNTIYLHGNII